jgi:PTS system sucrose-specific IIC component
VLNAFIGFYACKEFGGTPALGGAMAALLTAPGLADITLFGSPLVPGRGGVFASLLAGAVTGLVETRIRKRIPDSFSLFLTPLITLTIVSLTSIFIFQPLGGLLSDFLGYYTVHSIQQGGAVTGFVIGGIFLPVVMAGVHHGLTPIHADMLASMGMTILLPIAAMAGCGQVGASFAVYLKTKNRELKRTVLSSLPVGVMGIGEPLVEPTPSTYTRMPASLAALADSSAPPSWSSPSVITMIALPMPSSWVKLCVAISMARAISVP